MATPLYERIYEEVRRIPRGRVTSYGTIAKLAGFPRGAQMVGWALRAVPSGSDVPWQRVVNQKGQISIVNPKFPKTLQRSLLEEEGIKIQEENGWYVVDPAAWWPEEQKESSPSKL